MFESMFYYNENSTVNLVETDSEFIIELCALGLDKKDIEVKVKGNVLTVKSHKKQDNNKNYIIHEFIPDEINKRIEIPETIDTNSGINVKLENGILKIFLKKVPEKIIKVNFE